MLLLGLHSISYVSKVRVLGAEYLRKFIAFKTTEMRIGSLTLTKTSRILAVKPRVNSRRKDGL